MTGPRSTHRGTGISDAAMLALLGLAAGAIGLVWVWGGLAGLVLGRGWPRLGLGGLLNVLVSLPGHLDRPGLAWPGRVRPLLPGAAGLYGTLVVLAVALSLLVAILTPRLRRLLRPMDANGDDRNGWASARELRTLAATDRGPAWLRRRVGGTDRPTVRLALGRHRGRLLRAEARHALVAFGPPQSGKSAGLAIPALLEWDGPAVASSIKGDLLDVTLRRRQELGESLVFDPFALSAGRSHTWSPLRGSVTWDGALETAWRLAAAGELDQRAVDGGDFWAIAAEQRLAPLLFAAARGAGIGQLVAWAYGQQERELEETLERLIARAPTEAERNDALSAYDAVRGFATQADRTRSSIEATVQAILRAYRFTRVQRSAAGCEITADRLLSGSATLYLIGDPKASKLLRPLFLALLSEVIDRAYELANEDGGCLRRPLLVCLDEAGNVAPLPNLAEVASTAPSHGIQLISIFHDLNQARSRYGRQAETVVNSHRARMLLPGVADLDTLRYFSGLIGEHDQREQTRTVGDGGASRSVGRRRVALVAPEALRKLADGEALLLYGRLSPVRVRLRLWFRDRRLRRLQGGERG